jgi:hypothetical protein
MHVPCSIERKIQPSVCDLKKMVLDGFAFGELCGIHKLRGTHLDGPRFLAGVSVNGDDAGGTDEGCRRDDTEADGTTAKDRNVGPLYENSQS